MIFYNKDYNSLNVTQNALKLVSTAKHFTGCLDIISI